MKSLVWFVAFLVALEIAYLVVPEDVTLRLYISLFFMGGFFRGIVNTLWRKSDD